MGMYASPTAVHKELLMPQPPAAVTDALATNIVSLPFAVGSTDEFARQDGFTQALFRDAGNVTSVSRRLQDSTEAQPSQEAILLIESDEGDPLALANAQHTALLLRKYSGDGALGREQAERLRLLNERIEVLLADITERELSGTLSIIERIAAIRERREEIVKRMGPVQKR